VTNISQFNFTLDHFAKTINQQPTAFCSFLAIELKKFEALLVVLKSQGKLSIGVFSFFALILMTLTHICVFSLDRHSLQELLECWMEKYYSGYPDENIHRNTGAINRHCGERKSREV
jgi:hypothetical protein